MLSFELRKKFEAKDFFAPGAPGAPGSPLLPQQEIYKRSENGCDRTRTCDSQLRRLLLYPAELRTQVYVCLYYQTF